jgi:hypothetical protein
LKAPDSKSGGRFIPSRGFESLPFRHFFFPASFSCCPKRFAARFAGFKYKELAWIKVF